MIVTLILAAIALLLGIGRRTPADETRSDLAATAHSGNPWP